MTTAAISEGTLLQQRYRLDHVIGRGGMADVYVAEDVLLDRRVAVKIPLAPFRNDDRFGRRFAKEARAAAALTHPNIVSVYDRGDEGDTSYIVMELVEGESLRNLIDSRGFTEDESLRIIRDVCSALDYAHGRGFVHRDLKPDNVMIDRDGVVKVTDFGIVRAVGERTITSTRPLGSVAYVSPEQATGRTVDERSDLYSVGIVLYELLTGSRPFAAESPIAIALAHIETPPTPVHDLVPSVSDEAAAVVDRALQKAPEARFQRAYEMRDAIQKALSSRAEAAEAEAAARDHAGGPVIDLTTGDVETARRVDPDASTVPPYRLDPSGEVDAATTAGPPPTEAFDPEDEPGGGSVATTPPSASSAPVREPVAPRDVSERLRAVEADDGPDPGPEPEPVHRPTGSVDPTWSWNRQRLSLAVVAGLSLILLSGMFLGGPSREVPDLYGIGTVQATRIVAEHDMGMVVVGYDPDVDAPDGAIVRTVPAAGEPLPPGHAIRATVAGSPPS